MGVILVIIENVYIQLITFSLKSLILGLLMLTPPS